MTTMNQTNDPDRTSWVTSANDPATDFPLQNLPFGVFRRRGSGEPGRVGVAIGAMVFDIGSAATISAAQFDGHAACVAACATDSVATGILLATGRSWIEVADERLTVCGVLLDDAVLAETRDSALVAFGSCSFREPVDELTAFSRLEHR